MLICKIFGHKYLKYCGSYCNIKNYYLANNCLRCGKSLTARREQREENEGRIPERIRLEEDKIKAIEDFNLEISVLQQNYVKEISRL